MMKSLFVVIDNFRLDQWWLIKELLDNYYTIEDDELYYSILPTATQYARNAIFSGLMPLQIEELFPDLWIGEEDEENKNINEEELIQTQITRYRKKIDFSYHKINNTQAGEKLVEQLKQVENKQLNVCVLNFVDMLSHARTESKMIRELANSNQPTAHLQNHGFATRRLSHF